MCAAVHAAHGGPDVIEFVDMPDPAPGAGEVVVAVQAAALNQLDVLQRRGPAMVPGFSLPHTAGMDLARTVVCGANVSGVAVGDRVVVNPAVTGGDCAACTAGDNALCPCKSIIGANRSGGFAQLCVAPYGNVHPIPDGTSLRRSIDDPHQMVHRVASASLRSSWPSGSERL